MGEGRQERGRERKREGESLCERGGETEQREREMDAEGRARGVTEMGKRGSKKEYRIFLYAQRSEKY